MLFSEFSGEVSFYSFNESPNTDIRIKYKTCDFTFWWPSQQVLPRKSTGCRSISKMMIKKNTWLRILPLK